ncbi:MAG: hypothetical protein ACKOW0_00760 [Schleiferiaceae bacterium]
MSTPGSVNGAISAFGETGQLATALGLLAQEPGLVQAGSSLSQGANLANMAVNPSFNTIAPTVMSQLGVPGPVTGAVMGGYNNGVQGAIGGALTAASFSNPITAAYSLAAPSLGLPTISDAVNNIGTALSYGTTIGSEQTAALAAQDKGMFGPAATPVSGYSTSGSGGGWDGYNGGGGWSGGDTGGDYGGYGGGGYSGSFGGYSGGDSGDSGDSGGSYANGGAVGGQPMLSLGYADGGLMGNKPNPGLVNRRIDAALRDPQMRQTLLARPQALMASGELTIDEVQTMGRVAEAALYNPGLYPQLRKFVAEQGMTPLPPAFDQSVVLRIVAIARALQTETPAGVVPPTEQASMTPPVDGMRDGGYLRGPGTGRSDSIGTVNESTGQPVRVANGEYVIPAHVVRAKGQEFFDNLLRRYANDSKGAE